MASCLGTVAEFEGFSFRNPSSNQKPHSIESIYQPQYAKMAYVTQREKNKNKNLK